VANQITAVSQPAVGSGGTASWADTVGIITGYLAVATLGRKNALINSVGFPVNQRAAASVSATGYGVDRWLFTLGSGATSVLTPTTPTPGTTTGYIKQYLAWTRTVAGTTATTIEQRIESVSTFAGLSATVSILAWCASGTVDLTPSLVQNFGTGGAPSTAVTTTGSTITVTTTPTLYTVTISVPSISGKTLGTTSGTDYLSLVLSRPTAGNGPTTQINISAVQLEAGSAFTGWEVPSQQETLAQCQRYYVRWQGDATNIVYIAAGQATSATLALCMVPLPSPMRAMPTIGFSALADIGVLAAGGASTASSANPAVFNSPVSVGAGLSSVRITVTVAAGLVAGNAAVLHVVVGAAKFLDLTAEL